VGDAGALHVVEPWKPGLKGSASQVLFTSVGGQTETPTFPPVDPYLCEIEAMEAALLDGAKPVISLDQSRNFLRSALAIYAAARSGQPVQP
jgi:predicted dehydrogenase